MAQQALNLSQTKTSSSTTSKNVVKSKQNDNLDCMSIFADELSANIIKTAPSMNNVVASLGLESSDLSNMLFVVMKKINENTDILNRLNCCVVECTLCCQLIANHVRLPKNCLCFAFFTVVKCRAKKNRI